MSARVRLLALALAGVGALSTASAAKTRGRELRALRYLDLGIALFRKGRLTDARAAFVRARDTAPTKANPYRWLGIVDERLGHCADAVVNVDTFLARVDEADARRAEMVAIRDRCRPPPASAPSSPPPSLEPAPPPSLEPAPPPPSPTVVAPPLTRAPPDAEEVPAGVAPVAPRAPPPPSRRPRWLVGTLAAGSVAAAGLAVGLGLGLGLPPRFDGTVLDPVIANPPPE